MRCYSQAAHLACCYDCVCAERGKLRLLYCGSEHNFAPAAFWERCYSQINTLTIVKVSRSLSSSSCSSTCIASIEAACSLNSLLPFCLSVQVKESGNVFAVFTPVAWPTGSSGQIADPSGRTCIVSLVNKGSPGEQPVTRPFRLRLKKDREQYAAYQNASNGPCFGDGCDIALMTQGQSSCSPFSFELDAEAESKAGLPPLPFAYDKTLLSGVDDGRDQSGSRFSLAEMECYTLDA